MFTFGLNFLKNLTIIEVFNSFLPTLLKILVQKSTPSLASSKRNIYQVAINTFNCVMSIQNIYFPACVTISLCIKITLATNLLILDKQCFRK